MSQGEFLALLVDFYNLKALDILARKIRDKHINFMLSAADKAALSVLLIYLETILEPLL